MKRTLFWIAGWIAVALGTVGAFLPVLPTTPFMILAAFCFSKSSPRLHQWLLARPTVGPMIQSWQRHRVIPVPIKVYSISMIAAGGTFSCWMLRERSLFWQLLLLGLLGVGVGFILAQKSRI